MQAHKKDNRQHGLHAMDKKSEQSKRHDKNLKNLYRYEDGALAVNVGKIARIAGKNQKREDKQPADERNVLFRASSGYIESNQDDDHLIEVVVEGAEKLRAKETKKPAILEQVGVCTGSHRRLWLLSPRHFLLKRARNARACAGELTRAVS
jgi:hypothetical protein